jgi:hypothetical protein
MTKIFKSLVGRRCRAAQEFRAERQFCPTTMVKYFVVRPRQFSQAVRTCKSVEREENQEKGPRWSWARPKWEIPVQLSAARPRL